MTGKKEEKEEKKEKKEEKKEKKEEKKEKKEEKKEKEEEKKEKQEEKREKKEEKKEKKEEKKEKQEEKKEKKEEKKEKKEEKKEKKEEKKEKQEEKKEKKEEKKEKKEEKKEKKEEEVEVITAVFKVNIHCRECAREIKKPLLKTQGIYSVDIDCEKSEVKVKGEFDVIKIYKKIKKLSKKKVELISPQMEEVLKKKEEEAKKEEEKEIKEEIIRIISVKVHLHCEKCELDLRKKLLKQKAIYSVKTDMEAEILTIKGTIEPEKLFTYIRKKVHKHAEIIDSKTVKKKEKKKEEEEEKKEKKKEKKEKKEEEKVEEIFIEKTKIIEFKEEVTVEVKSKEGEAPYFIHYVYAPQYFSDENPNACIVM